jgi:hypothetical protein
MGCSPFLSKDSYPQSDCKSNTELDKALVEARRNYNPQPDNYHIINHLEINDFLIVEILYPDCQNYEGRKILMYENTTLAKLLTQKLIDPHFSTSEKYQSPIARFEPTKRGMMMAIKLAKNL